MSHLRPITGFSAAVAVGSALILIGLRIPAAYAQVTAPKANLPADAAKKPPAIWKEQRTLTGHKASIFCAAFSPDDKLLVTGTVGYQGPPGEFKIWDALTGRDLKTVLARGSVRCVSFSPDGKSFATAEVEGQGAARLRDTESAEVIRSFVGHTRPIDSLAISADGEWLATGGLDKTVLIWNVKSGEMMSKLDGHKGEVYAVAFSPKGRRVLSGDGANVAILWDADKGEILHTLLGHKKAIQVVAFSRDGKTLVTGGWDETLKLWDADTGMELATLKAHGAAVLGLTFSPDGRLMASSSGRWGYEDNETVKKSTGEVILWDFEARKPLATLRAHAERIFGLSFTSDGKTLATTGFDKEVKLWRGFQSRKAAAPLSAQELDALWKQLAGADLGARNTAVETLGGMSEQSLPFLMERLRAIKRTEPERSAAALIGQLADEKLKVRELASRELAKLGTDIAPQLRIALEKGPTVEGRRRLNALLADMKADLTPEQQRLQYAAVAIELIGSPDAHKALVELSQGGSGSLVAEEALAAIRRREFREK